MRLVHDLRRHLGSCFVLKIPRLVRIGPSSAVCVNRRFFKRVGHLVNIFTCVLLSTIFTNTCGPTKYLYCADLPKFDHNIGMFVVSLQDDSQRMIASHAATIVCNHLAKLLQKIKRS